ncbi:FG-GAP-like repeat-containing protein [Streptomyces iconiensis]|uniref:FG-GAP repeat-containing protein n=1 Tax=Streptomyces iconiensis TaxID=1384038 RepID=A0ABT7A461_9ACTN|nr:FG-GAP-like repeat-containing protein [Streptomyces iconiensis]MDJ1136133.1 hypothetical protein [Streptomyces iconiensis]
MRRTTKGALAIGIGVALAGGLAVTAGASPLPAFDSDSPSPASSPATQSAQAAGAAKKKVEVREDFNGDGYNDLAIGAPEGNGKAGYVAVVYGSANGLDTKTRTVIDQDTEGVPGTAEEGNRFGSKLVARDLDGDGVTDLAVQAQSAGGSALTVLWGAKGEGVTGKDAVRHADVEEPVGGDFDGDGKSDLFVADNGAGDSKLLRGPFSRDGKPAAEQSVDLSDGDAEVYQLMAGDVTGDGADDLVVARAMEESSRPGAFFKGGKSGLTKVNDKAPEAQNGAIGDFDGDGFGDLAYRVPLGGVIEGPWSEPGSVKVVYGTAKGLGTRTATFTQATSGVPGANEEGDIFGTSLAAGDANGDGYDDLAAGVPGEAIGTKDKAGSAVLLKGSKKGLSGAGAQAFSQDTTGVPGVAEAGDLFGTNMRLLDTNGDKKADLAVSAPGENNYNGAVWSVPGATAGLDPAKSTSFSPEDLNASPDGATFGSVFNNSATSPLWGIVDR